METSNRRTAHTWNVMPRTDDVQIDEKVTFVGLLLSEPVLQGLKISGFDRPSPIQIEAIPLGRCGLDLVVQAKSGTGKTCVFAVVALENVDVTCSSTQVLVLAPTREIAVQIQQVICAIGCAVTQLRCQTFIGGLPLADDVVKLKKCHVAVGTPGRIKQLISEEVLKVESIRIFILDEADKLLESGFQEDINWIYSTLPANKQMITLSATYPESLAQHITSYMRSPVFVRLNAKDPSLLGVRQYYKQLPYRPLPQKMFELKCAALMDLLSSVDFDQCLVFSNYHLRAESLNSRLNACGWPSAFINGAQDQMDRLSAMSKLKKFQCRVFISTDLTARGIDAENVNLIVNLDLPHDHETYLHRIGRAGRFGTYGAAVTFVCGDGEQQTLEQFSDVCRMCISPLPVPVPVGLAREFTTVGLENDSMLSDDSACSSSRQDDAVSKSVSLNHDQTNELFDGEISAVNSSHTNSDLHVFEMSDNSDLFACQLKSNVDGMSAEASLTDPVVADNERLPKDTVSPDVICVSSPQASNSNVENSLSQEDSEPVDLVELGSALWPKSKLTVGDDVDCSFDALVADHADYCKENTTADSTSQEIILHGCCGQTESVHDHQEALWPVVFKWLKQSDEQFSKQLPRCSALVDGMLASDTMFETLTAAGSNWKVPDLTPVSTGTNTTVVSSVVTSQTNSSVSDLSNARRFGGTESEGNSHCPSPTFSLSRAQMLSLQFSGVPLSAEVMARVSELKLRRADGAVQAPAGKPRHSQLYERVKANSVAKTTIQLTESQTHSISAENTNNKQLMNRSNVKREDVLVHVDITAGSGKTDMEDRKSLTSNLESVNCVDVASGKTETVLVVNGTQQSKSDKVPSVLYFQPASDTSADQSVGNTTSGNKSPMCYPNLNVQTACEGALKSGGIGAGSVSSSIELPSIGGNTAISDMCAITQSKSTRTARKSGLSTHASSVTDGERPPCTKKYSTRVNDRSETTVNQKCHKDHVSSQEQHHVPTVKHGVVTREMDERITKELHHKSRKSHQYNTASVAAASDPPSRPGSRHAKCSRCQNVKHKTYPLHDYAYDWHSNQRYSPSYAFDHYGGYSPYCMPNVMTPSVLASVSYSSYCLGAYDAHMESMRYYDMLSQRDTGTADLWQQQADYIRRMTKLYAHS